MIRYARLCPGLTLVHADAKALPFRNGAYKTIIYATGVMDFISDEEEIRGIMNEGGRIAEYSGNIFVVFYRFSAAIEDFVIRLGLLRNSVLRFQELLEVYRLTPVQTTDMVRVPSSTWAISCWERPDFLARAYWESPRPERICSRRQNQIALQTVK